MGLNILVLKQRTEGPPIVDCPPLFIEYTYSNMYVLLINLHVKHGRRDGLCGRQTYVWIYAL